ncbi:MAG: NAC family transcription factor [Methanomicrobiales archaeon]|nr:NAC family transcription factor [Methanomicrobiales archaeon]
MGGDGKDGSYCTICGGIPPDQVKIKKILIDGKETGIDRLDWTLLDVYNLGLHNATAITDELEKRVRQFNYIPTKKIAEYREALLREYRMLRPDDISRIREQVARDS